MENQQKNSLPGINDLLNKAWQIYKERIWVFLGIMVLPLMLQLFFIIWEIRSGLSVQLAREDVILPWAIKFFLSIPPFFILFFVLIIILLSLWYSLALIYAIKERDQKIGIRESFAKGWPKIISYLWVSILVGLVIIIGLLLLIIPGIIFVVWFSLVAYVLVVEGLTGKKALSRSKELVSGYWWEVFWRLSAMIMITVIFSFIINIVEKLIGVPEKINISSIITSFFFTPFTVIYDFLIYEELKKVKEEVSV